MGANIFDRALEKIYEHVSLRSTGPYSRKTEPEYGVFWEENGCRIAVDLEDSFVEFKVYPGIVVPPAFYGPVAEYCLKKTSTVLSWFRIDTSNGEIACCSSLPIIECPLEFLTIDFVVDYMLAQVKKHREMLSDLAYGRAAVDMPDKAPLSYPHRIEEDFRLVSEERWKAQIAVIRDYLSGNGHHGFYSESFDSSTMTPSWQVELGADDNDGTPIGFHTYTLFYQPDRQGFLEIGACKGKQGTLIEPAYQKQAVEKLLCDSLAEEAGNFSIGEFCPGVSFQRRIGFIDRLVTEETLGEIDHSVLKAIRRTWRSLETVSHGMPASVWESGSDRPDEKEDAEDEEELPFT